MNSLRSFLALSLFTSFLSLSSVPARAAGAATLPSGDLNVVGTVMVDGERAESGRTIFSGATVETAEGALSTISLGRQGRVELSAESELKLIFTDSSLDGLLKSGSVRVSVPAG